MTAQFTYQGSTRSRWPDSPAPMLLQPPSTAVTRRRGWKLFSGQQYQFAEQVGFGTSVHRGLQLLDAVDGAFDRTGVVMQGEPGDDGVQVAAQTCGERPQRGQ